MAIVAVALLEIDSIPKHAFAGVAVSHHNSIGGIDLPS